MFPKWLRTWMGVNAPVTLKNELGTIRVTKGLDIQLRRVCGSCNHVWLNDLEEDFRNLMVPALIGSHEVDLDAEAQRIVSLWGVKTWLLGDMALKVHRNVATNSPETLRFLRATGRVPDNIEVRVGATYDARAVGLFASVDMALFFLGDDKEPIAVMAILTIGHLLFHFFAPFDAGIFAPGGWPKLGLGAALNPFFVQIWPVDPAGVRWPPPTQMPTVDLDNLFPPNRIFRMLRAPAPETP